MKTVEIVYSVIGGLFTLCLASLGFLAVRLINQYDDFQRSTNTNIKAIRSGIRMQERTIETIKSKATIAAERSGVDEETKAQISKILLSIAKIEKEINRIKPILEISEEDHGKVLIIDDKLRSQDKILKTMFDTLKTLAQKVR